MGDRAFVEELTIESSPASGDTYVAGEIIEIKATFDREVTVDGTVYMTLRFGENNSDWASASYFEGSGTSSLVFRHTVKPGEYDPDGITVVNGRVADDGTQYGFGGGGTIRSWNSDTEEWADVSPRFDGMETQSDHKIETVPYVTHFAITSTPPNGKHYRIGDMITITATFDQNVATTQPLSVPVTIGTGFHTETWTANLSSDSADNKLVFKYTVGANQRDDDGITVAGGGRILDDGSVQSATNPTVADRTVTKLLNQADHKVYAYYPLVQTVSITSAPEEGDTYWAGETIEVSLEFQNDIEVEVAGTPSIRLLMGDDDLRRDAVYSSGSGTDTIVFAYVVQADDLDMDGVALMKRNSEGLDGDGHIKEKGTDNRFGGAIPGLGDQENHKVRGRPYVTTASVTSTPAGNGVYRSGEVIKATLSFDRSMEVDGEVTIPMTMGDGEVQAAYLSGSETSNLVFGYEVKDSDEDADGVSLPAKDSGAFSGAGTIQSAGTEIAPDGALPSVGADEGHKVYGLVHVVSVSVDSEPGDDDTYENGEAISVSVEFDDDVTVTGTPQLSLDFDGTAKIAGFQSAKSASGDGSDNTSKTGDILVFSYTVQEGDEDTDGFTVTENGLGLNGGTIVSSNGKNAKLDYASVNAEGQQVGAVPPEFDSAATSEDGAEIVVTFTEDVQLVPEIETVFAYAGIDSSVFLRSLVDILVEGHMPPVTAASVAGKELTLKMDSAITEGQTVQVAYDNIFAADVSGLLTDKAGNALAEFSTQDVTNNSTVPDDDNANWAKPSVHSLIVEEGGSVSYTVSLKAQPTSDVTVTLSLSHSDHLTADVEELVFTTNNWNVAQTVTLTSVNDSNDQNDWLEILHESTAESFISGVVKVVIEDTGDNS